MKRSTVLLADDHAIVVEGLRRVLEPDFDVIGVAADGRSLVTAAATLNPDVIIIDVSMPLLNGIEAARRIRKTDTHAKLVFLTMHPDVIYVSEALQAGGSAYVLKSGRLCAEGHTCRPPSTTSPLKPRREGRNTGRTF